MKTTSTRTRTETGTTRIEAPDQETLTLRSPGSGTRLALGLGSNLGDPVAQLGWAVHALRGWISDLTVASLYRSRPQSLIEQPDFLNTAAIGRTLLDPGSLLAIAKALELAAGRARGPRFGPRALDIDLLLFGSEQRRDPELTLPHPRLRSRRFVLEPLAEIAPDWVVPGSRRTVTEMLAAVDQADEVERLADRRWWPGVD